MRIRPVLIGLVLVVTFGLGTVGGVSLAEEGTVDQRIARFWERVNAMAPNDYLGSSDLGQWALNVIERDPRARLTVADFRAATATMQQAFDRAGPAPAASQPPATQPPATPRPSATPRLVPTIGQSFTYTNGWRLTVLKLEEQPAGRFQTPDPGTRYVTVTVKFENGGTLAQSASPYAFKLQDSTGVRRSRTYYSDRNDQLALGDVAPGAFVVGSMVFLAPVGDTRLRLIYEEYGYQQATFELF